MRTRALLCAAALAAGAVSSMAQNVYSLNVVGYVNKSFSSGNYVLVGNPLNGTNNNLSTIIPSPPNFTVINRWNASIQDLDPVQPTFFTSTGKWNSDPVLNPGEGFFVIAGANFTNTFVGNVPQGSLTNPVPIIGGGNYVAVAPNVPIGGGISNILSGYVPGNFDVVNTWNVGIQDLDPNQPTYFTSTGKWNSDVNLAVGDGFFLIRAGAATKWVQNFTVQ
jgi:hypothetical protein